jgi:hypothetical protein
MGSRRICYFDSGIHGPHIVRLVNCGILMPAQRFILPRLTRSLEARHALASHQRRLMMQLTSSLDELKTARKEAFSILPAPTRRYEDERSAECHTIEDLLELKTDESIAVSMWNTALLRCAIEQCVARDKHQPTADVVLDFIKDKKALTSADQDALYEVKIYPLPTVTVVMTCCSACAVRLCSRRRWMTRRSYGGLTQCRPHPHHPNWRALSQLWH